MSKRYPDISGETLFFRFISSLNNWTAMIENTFFQPCDKQISVIFTLFPVSCEIELLFVPVEKK